MHELTICANLIELLDGERRRRGFRTVKRLRLEIGRFSCLDPEALRFAFEISSRDTFLHAAALEIERPPGRATCLDCGAAVEVESRLDACPHCGGVRLDPTGGDRMRLIEMEVR
ncbi:[NiFe] hydrogenase nickel incorporation protein HypA [Rhodovulum sp. PH10]|uniref:hydrogenase maturation nickel metallochaperone HypA n=1 Tax=Rhodovulum sp. PH10 TaxID=1187851 RepID=UPI00027C2D6A|nr:hydrogenase maturation nickel metallochaperone HypA [Rhodovulum sp. PH10]EJW09924.1 [NiFe] hydrogenase nickel incorporation protein HypA [Rhodovulum sp. PH10]